jgi:cytokinesis protein
MQPAGLLSAIAGGAKLKSGKDRKVTLTPDSRIIGKDQVVGPAGSLISPPPAGIWVPPPPGAPGMAPPPPAVFVSKTLAAPRKDGITARIQMKQVVWEKINPLQMEKTVWGSKDIDEDQFIKRMQAEGIFEQMEEDFQAKKAAQKAAAKKKDDLVSVLNAKTRERIGKSPLNLRNCIELIQHHRNPAQEPFQRPRSCWQGSRHLTAHLRI